MKRLVYRIYDKFTFNQVKYLKTFLKLDNLTGESLLKYQLQKIKKCTSDHGLNVDSWEDFYKLPITTKQDLPDNKPVTKKYKKHETSGSTGEPRKIYVPEETWYRKDAIFTRSWIKMGRKNQWVFRLIAGEPSYAFYDWWRNVKPMNYRNVGKEHVDWVVKNKPYLIHGPGGAIRQLCELILQAGHEDILKEIKIHWCSESSSGHKERLQPLVKEFHEQYGLAEMPTVAATDGLGNLKVVGEKCFVEILDDDGNKVEDGQEGYIVVTDFNNDITPIIRYKSGDRGKLRLHEAGYYVLYDIIGRGVDYYDGPEVKRAVGWWVVSPISHTLGDLIDQWRVEIHPKRQELVLHFKGSAEATNLKFNEYADWVKENLGLNTSVVKSEEKLDYKIYWKNKLVKVVIDE